MLLNSLKKLLHAVSLLFMASAAMAAERGALINVPEAGNYDLVYSLNIPNSPNYGGGVVYDIDLRTYTTSFNRVAYYLELQQNGGPLNFIWVSMDPFTSDINQVGVPTLDTGMVIQQPVANMNVVSSVAGIVTGTNLTGGNLEFWPYNYDGFNAAGVPNASDTDFDWGDNVPYNGNYGSMQVCNGEASQILLAFNRWGGFGGVADVGIGNNTNGNPDYTFAQNASSYTVKTLQVFVMPSSNVTPPALTGATGLTGLTNVVLTFSKALENDATNVSHYTLNGGVSVLNASLEPINRLSVTLTTSPQQPLTGYSVTVNGVRDQTPAHLEVAPNSAHYFKSSIAGRGASANVPEAAGYKLVYSLDIPDTANYKTGLVYNVDQRAEISGFSRVAYYLELQKPGGLLNYLWISMDAFTTNVNRIGIPVLPSGAVFQQPVANMNVASSVDGVTLGQNLAGGNLEFWPTDYQSTNSAAVPNASDDAYDWGDMPTPGQYGSMQIHNSDASQVLLAFNNWGGNNAVADLGIGNNPSGQPDWTFAGNASAYSIKTLQVFVVPIYDTNRPTVLSTIGVGGLTNVVLTFSKPLDDSATNASHYTIDGGITVLGAVLDPVTKSTVTLTTTPQQSNIPYTVTVNGVFERSGFKTPIAPNSTFAFTSSLVPGALHNVPEAQTYNLVYSLNIPDSANYSGGITYDIDLRNYVTAFTRVAYYLELQKTDGPLNYVWVSMDAFTSDVNQIGVPTVASGVTFQQPVANMNVLSSVAGIVTGTSLTGGNLEFWPYNYDAFNAALVPNASDTAFDWGDNMATSGNHGSMQVCNAEASQVLFGFNRWGGASGIVDLGIGNNPNGEPDWTFAANASGYTVKTLQVYILPSSSATPPAFAGAKGLSGLTNVVLTFSKALEDDATNISHYALNGGVNVLKATLEPANRLEVTLTTSAQQPLTSYTVTVNGVRDQTPSHLEVAPNSTATFKSSVAGRGAALNVPEAADYSLVYSLDIPNEANYLNGVSYTVDQHAGISAFSRVAYYLELQSAVGPLNYIWVSMDAFTTNVNRIGVPTVPSGAVFQQPVANMNVASSVESISTGKNLAGGNIEFWPSNYTEPNASGVPNASDTTFDWGDTVTAGTYGSMQVHNADASQVLFAFNNWGGSGGIACIGIGNNPNGQPDWTFAGNASTYTVKTLQVYVLLNQKPFKIISQGFQSAGNFKVTCEAQTGNTYTLWRKLDLTGSPWTRIAETIATSSTASLLDTQATNGVSFYQVRAP